MFPRFLSIAALLGLILIGETAWANEHSSRIVRKSRSSQKVYLPDDVRHSVSKTKAVRIDAETLLGSKAKELKGWEFLYASLVRTGLDPEKAHQLLSDPRMPKHTPVFYSVEPKESAASYRKRNVRSEYDNAMAFYQKYFPYFKLASSEFKVPESVMLSILQIETRCGDYTGNAQVFHRLARLVSTAAPENIDRNFAEKKRADNSLTREDVEYRASFLKRTFLPHTLAVMEVADHLGLHPLELRGSYAGAVGLPQFMPGNYFRYGHDGDLDGKIDLFSPADAIFSLAKFLKSNGWEELELSEEEQRKAIWNYNRSEPYVSVVLAMAKKLRGRMSDVKVDGPNDFIRRLMPIRTLSVVTLD